MMTLQEIRAHYGGQTGQRRLRRILGLGVISVLLIAIYFWIGPQRFTGHLLDTVELAREHPITFILGLFIFWMALFMTAAPLGSVTAITAGYVFGPFFGLVQAAAQLLSSLLLYRLLPKPENLLLEKSRMLSFARGHPIAFVCLIRLIPILPSAVSVVAYRELDIAQRDMVIGTLSVGWIRPVSLAWVGSQLPNLAALFEKLT